MKRILGALCIVLWIFSGCNGSSDHGKANKDSGLQFSVDTGQLKHLDSVRVEQRRSDSMLLQNANHTPGINAGAGHFSIGVPRGWRRVDTLLGNIRALVLDTASAISGFRTNINVVSDSLRGMSVDEYQNGTISSLAQYLPHFSLIGKGERTIGGRAARWLHYSQDRDGTILENICYIIPDNGIAYILTCSALKSRLLQNRSAFEQAVTSFTLQGQ